MAEQPDVRRLQRGLRAAADRRHVRDRPVHDELQGERAQRQIQALDAQRGEREARCR